jgi:hypothetical protein
MGLREFLTGIQKNASTLRNNLGKSISNSISGLQSYVSGVWPQRKSEVSLKDLDVDEFDKLARERGYRKVSEDYYEERERRATEAEATPRGMSVEEEEEYYRQMDKPLTKDEWERLGYYFYAKYRYEKEARRLTKNGYTEWEPVSIGQKETNQHQNIQGVKNELLFFTGIEKLDTGSEVKTIITEYTIYRVAMETGREEVIETGSITNVG